MDKKETLKNILINCGHALYRRFCSEKRPDHLLHHKLWNEMGIWEKRMFGGKDGKPVPVKSFMDGDLPSHAECENALEEALRTGFFGKISSFLDL